MSRFSIYSPLRLIPARLSNTLNTGLRKRYDSKLLMIPSQTLRLYPQIASSQGLPVVISKLGSTLNLRRRCPPPHTHTHNLPNRQVGGGVSEISWNTWADPCWVSAVNVTDSDLGGIISLHHWPLCINEGLLVIFWIPLAVYWDRLVHFAAVFLCASSSVWKIFWLLH